MSDWKLFPFWEPRPDVPKFGETDRAVLEDLIARQVADLLGQYAIIDDVEIDQSSCPEANETKTYRALDLDPFRLEDGGELQIHQIPYLNEELVIKPGCHGISKEDEYGEAEFEAVVWDPSLNISPNVITTEGAPIDISILQELYEVLIVAGGIIAQVETANNPPHDTALFPMPTTDVDFEAIIGNL